jgi:hypothetical protein
VDLRARAAKQAANAAKGIAPSLIDPRFDRPEERRVNDGSSAASGKLSTLRFLQSTLRFDLDLASCLVTGAVVNIGLKPAEPAPPLTVGMVLGLHHIASGHDVPQQAKVQAAQWLAILYSATRLEQAQMTDMQVEDDVAAYGVTLAKAHKTKPRPCLVVVPNEGIVGGTCYFEVFKSSIPPRATFILCDVEGGDGNPFHAKAGALANRGATWSRANASLKGLLHAVGVPADKLCWFTPHSVRHALPHIALLTHIALLRGEDAEERNQIGAWYGSLFQDRGMIPGLREPQHRRPTMRRNPRPSTSATLC